MRLYKKPNSRYCGMCSIPTRAPVAKDLGFDFPLCGMCRTRYERSQSKTAAIGAENVSPLASFSVPEVVIAKTGLYHGAVKSGDRLVLNVELSGKRFTTYDTYRDGVRSELGSVSFAIDTLKHLMSVGSLVREGA